MLRSARHLPVALFLALFLASSAAPAVPVGYDHPQSDQGGPTVAGGLGWIAEVWPHTLILADKPVGGKPTVMFITNFSAPPALHELNRRFPMDALLVAPPSTNEFPGREAFLRALRSRRRVDCFVFSRVKESSIPADVQYEILRRVKDDGAGIVVIDLFDRSPTFNPQFLASSPRRAGRNSSPASPTTACASTPTLRRTATRRSTTGTPVAYWPRPRRPSPSGMPASRSRRSGRARWCGSAPAPTGSAITAGGRCCRTSSSAATCGSRRTTCTATPPS